MRLFGLFDKIKGNTNTVPFQLTQPMDQEAADELLDDASVIDEPVKETKPLTVSYATGWPIDIIYGYLHKNYEQKGYDDAMLNTNLAFRDMNKNIIRNKILMTFREINLNYDAMMNDIENRIQNASALGLLTDIAEFDKTIAVIKAHKSELSKLEADLRNNVNEASYPLVSYECGFIRGVSTVNMAGTPKSRNPQSSAVPSLSKNSMAV